jgi:O-antigen/teichoic acid export membrane protein
LAVLRHIDKISSRLNASLKGSFARDFSKVFSGNIVAQIIVIAATPLITRIYTPEAFGGMAFISSWIGVFAVVSCLRYDQAIILPKDDSAAYNLATLSLVVLIAIFALGLSVAIPITYWGGTYSPYCALFWIVPIGALFTGLKDILFACNTRCKLFGTIAGAQVVAAAASIGFKLVYGFVFSPDAEGLLIGNIIGLIAGAFLLVASIWPVMPLFRRQLSLPGIKRQASEYAKFPKFSTLNGLLNVVSQNLPVFLLGFFFSPQIVGFYGLGNAVLRKPVQTVGVSISRVFVQRASVYQASRADMRPILLKATLGLGIVGLFPFLLILTYGDILFVSVFGSEWETAGVYCRILTPWLFMLFINPPATQVLIVKQDLQFNLYLMIVSIFARGACIMAGVIFFDSILVSLTLFSGAGVVLNLFYIRRAFLLCNR